MKTVVMVERTDSVLLDMAKRVSRRTVVVPDKMWGNTRAIFIGKELKHVDLCNFIYLTLRYGVTGRAVRYRSGRWTFMPDEHADTEVPVKRVDLYFPK